MERWRLEMAKGIPDKDIAEAKNILELRGPKIESTALRKAYRSLARMYHPDRNPAGREMFEKGANGLRTAFNCRDEGQ